MSESASKKPHWNKIEYAARAPSFPVVLACLIGMFFNLPVMMVRHGLVGGLVQTWRASYLATWRSRFDRVLSLATNNNKWHVQVNGVLLSGYDGIIYHVIFKDRESGREGMAYFWDGSSRPFKGLQERFMLRQHNLPVAPLPVGCMKNVLTGTVGVPVSIVDGLSEAMAYAERALGEDEADE